jgi:hypothetical protein
MNPQVVVNNLRKVYRVSERETGLRAAIGAISFWWWGQRLGQE